MAETPNRSIRCAAKNCKNHCGDCDCCSLSQISVGEHGQTGTDCCSFECSDIIGNMLIEEHVEEDD